MHTMKTFQTMKDKFNDILISKNIKIMYHIKNVLSIDEFPYIKSYGII